MRTPSLNKRICWQQVLRHLGCPLPSGALPLVTTCPVCKTNQFYVLHDNIYGGAWHYCFHCRTAGGTPEILAAAWKCPLADALWRLHREAGIVPQSALYEDEIQRHLQGPSAKNTEIRALVERASARVTKDPGPILKMLCGPGWPDLGKMADKAAKIIGYCPLAELKEALGDRLKGAPRLKKRNDQAVLVLPAYDLPGRLSGLVVAFSRQDVVKKAKFVPLLPARTVNGQWHLEAGVNLLSSVFTRNPAGFQDHILIVDSYWAAARLQLQYLRDGQFPLPVLGTQFRMQLRGKRRVAAYPRNCFTFLGSRRITLYAAEMCGPLLSAADCSGGTLAIRQDLGTDGTPIHVMLKTLLRSARPWDVAAAKWLQRAPEDSAAALLADAALSDAGTRRLRDQVAPAVRGLLRIRQQAAGADKVVTLGTDEIRETRDGWVCCRSGELVSPVVLKIDRIIRRPTDVQYVGEVRLGSRRAAFVCPAAALERNPVAWLRKTCVREGLGIPVFSARKKWRSALLDIALAFHRPQVVENPAGVGWNEPAQSFLFPQFRISPGDGIVQDPGGFEPSAPCYSLPTPQDRVAQDLGTFCRSSPDNIHSWAGLLAFATAIVSPTLREDFPSILLCGPAATAAGKRTAGALGAPTVGPSATEFVQRDAHNWPVLLQPEIDPRKLRHRKLLQELLSTAAGRVVACVPQAAARRMLLSPGYLVFESDDMLPASPLIDIFAPPVLFSWLEDFVGGGCYLPPANTLLERVLLSFRSWLKLRKQPYVVLSRAAGLLQDSALPQTATDALWWLLYSGLEESTIRYQHAEFMDPRADPAASLFELSDPAGIFVSYSALAKICNRIKLPIPDRWQLLARLAATDIFLQEHEVEGLHGILIHRDWWVTQLHNQTPTEHDHADQPSRRVL